MISLQNITRLPHHLQQTLIEAHPMSTETICSRLSEMADEEASPHKAKQLRELAEEAKGRWLEEIITEGLSAQEKLNLIQRYGTVRQILQAMPYEVNNACERHYERKLSKYAQLKVFDELQGAPRANAVIEDVLGAADLRVAPGPSVEVVCTDGQHSHRNMQHAQ